ncbi:MAG: hypothetical protein SO170_10400 [Butyribacter sp.]|nr:hypothetical protein [bacterium]MDY3855346.1 hypothetical protein [Butyribacter sp.]
MENFERISKYDSVYDFIIYSSIYDKIKFEIKYGTEDKRKELKYLVNRYCNDVVISGSYLQEKYYEYVKVLKDKGIISD